MRWKACSTSLPGDAQLSTSYVKELHAALLRNVDVHIVVDQFGQAFEKRLEKGLYKTSAKQPYAPGRIDPRVLPARACYIRNGRAHSAYIWVMTRVRIPPEVEAAWLHHRFTQIHPFADGNGRVARAVASLVFIRAGWFPLIIQREDKARYIEALEKADAGDLRHLVFLFVEAQRNALMQATEVAYDVRPITSTHEAVLAARDRLLQRGRLPLREWLAAKEVAKQLSDQAMKQFGSVATELQREIGTVGKGFGFSVSGGPQNRA